MELSRCAKKLGTHVCSRDRRASTSRMSHLLTHPRVGSSFLVLVGIHQLHVWVIDEIHEGRLSKFDNVEPCSGAGTYSSPATCRSARVHDESSQDSGRVIQHCSPAENSLAVTLLRTLSEPPSESLSCQLLVTHLGKRNVAASLKRSAASFLSNAAYNAACNLFDAHATFRHTWHHQLCSRKRCTRSRQLQAIMIFLRHVNSKFN